ncbi:class A beta-lactamase-related serine hydrolase [Tetragenococcus koreensis]|uniref:serine hydrolase n=1 Tax=Tetragenococcus koreensis TaxID=290335 RepID=UPI001F36A723|nr:serine hydrolase [Tetragenococcus koreensis]MDN6729341.1 class A beta-lactamase-related serine hydrolase [Alkalibacterium sp.]MCF1585693.1 class A beta-lactamase-related serine hydrolase [Tetragenococcus koreensis]MCF1615326.1 class A beta-lactamase-related serine hydrolase [Tetragenococcus koreensis]MCF1618686.1 class A beta-lactamase-related serine hydrolase [Tetragenococcus koreensis]MCF1625117.1 class A beta-lactamase-related serine hydrolase [Tetragenococcus koreensis]
MNKFLKILPVLLGIILLLAIGFWYEDSVEINEEETAESTTTTRSEVAKEPQKEEDNLEEQLQQTGDQLAEEYPNSLEFMVYDLDTEETYRYTNDEEDRLYETASIVKVAVAMLLFHEKEINQEELTEEETERLSSMILSSDNDATSALLNESLGGFESLQTIFDELGMSNTTVNLGNWGNSTTTAKDQMKLLKELYLPSDYISDESQDYIIDLMTQIDEDQSWGVYAGSDDVSFKNGWLTDVVSGEWIVTSIGKVSRGDNEYLAVALSDENPSVEDGSHVIEELIGVTSDYLL